MLPVQVADRWSRAVCLSLDVTHSSLTHEFIFLVMLVGGDLWSGRPAPIAAVATHSHSMSHLSCRSESNYIYRRCKRQQIWAMFLCTSLKYVQVCTCH